MPLRCTFAASQYCQKWLLMPQMLICIMVPSLAYTAFVGRCAPVEIEVELLAEKIHRMNVGCLVQVRHRWVDEEAVGDGRHVSRLWRVLRRGDGRSSVCGADAVPERRQEDSSASMSLIRGGATAAVKTAGSIRRRATLAISARLGGTAELERPE